MFIEQKFILFCFFFIPFCVRKFSCCRGPFAARRQCINKSALVSIRQTKACLCWKEKNAMQKKMHRVCIYVVNRLNRAKIQKEVPRRINCVIHAKSSKCWKWLFVENNSKQAKWCEAKIIELNFKETDAASLSLPLSFIHSDRFTRMCTNLAVIPCTHAYLCMIFMESS